jgi:hypothetical protein
VLGHVEGGGLSDVRNELREVLRLLEGESPLRMVGVEGRTVGLPALERLRQTA